MTNKITFTIDETFLSTFFGAGSPDAHEGFAWTTGEIVVADENTIPDHTTATLTGSVVSKVPDPEAHKPDHLRTVPKPNPAYHRILEFTLVDEGPAITSCCHVPATAIKSLVLNCE